MLQQILKDMYIDPEVLEALNEEQKKTLFLKMRQEQVRRWKEREEKLEREGGDAESKRSVSWQLGRDGDVAVVVIGEVDELSSKFICSGFGEKKTPSLQNNTSHQTILKDRKNMEPVKTERENLLSKTQPDVSLNLKVCVAVYIGESEKLQKASSEEPWTSGSAPVCAGRGRVAQLMKTFSVDTALNPAQTPSRGIKPPLPTKPSHLRQTSTPTVR
uniref:Zgc:100829 n=1 Tax=Neolamprologus brichardi TaxID=32507 RepID=A0A3Q4MDW9_NEOBR